MVWLRNRAFDIETGDPFTTGNAEIYGPDNVLIASPALDGVTGVWEHKANGQPGVTRQEYDGGGQIKVVYGDSFGQAGSTSEGEIESLFAMFTSGVITGMTLSAPGAMAVRTAIGLGIHGGTLHPIYTAEDKTIEAADPSNPRIDRIVSRKTKTGTFIGRVVLAVVKGTPAASPTAPALTNDADTSEFEIGRVTVPAGASSIVTGNLSIASQTPASGPIIDGSITTAKLADLGVTTAKIADGAVTAAKMASGVLVPVSPVARSGLYFSSRRVMAGGSGTLSFPNSTILATPIYFPKATTIDRMGVYWTAISGSGTLRVGVYNIDTDGFPTTLVGEGSVAITTPAGFKQATVSIVIPAPGWYWIAAGNSGIATSTVRSYGSLMDMLGSSIAGDQTAYGFLTASSAMSGGMPSPFPTPGITSGGPEIWVRTTG